MQSFLESINMFPETRYLRIKRGPELDHRCGGFSSLAILLILFIVLAIKLHEAFKKQTVFFTTQTKVDQVPIMANLSTYQKRENQSPFMMAFFLWDRGCTNITYSISASIYARYNYTTDNWYKESINVPLEKCTVEHFSKIPQLVPVKNKVQMDKWYCLPLNTSIQIGGHFQIGDSYKGLQISISCKNPCQIDSCGTALIYHLSSLINPNNEQPFEHILKRAEMDLTTNTFNAYAIRIDESIVTTDSSLLPYAEQNVKRSYSSNPIQYRASILKRNPSITLLWVERSPFTNLVQRRYLKLIDVASYVGGILPALFGVFFFMKFFGKYFFQMTFAYQHYQCKQTRKVHFPQFIKLSIYSMFKKLGFEPKNWVMAQRQYEINEKINQLLDINYLYKRIQFLECAINSLLDEYQLKGIYLTHMNLKKSTKQFKKHRIRDRLISFLGQRIESQEHEIEKEGKIKQQIKQDKLEKPRKKQIKFEDIQQQLESSKNLRKVSSKEQILFKMKNKKYFDQKNGQGDKTPLSKRVSQFQKELARKESISCLKYSKVMVEKMSDQELDVNNLKKDLKNDLKKLLKDVKNKDGNPVSKRIVASIDPWLVQQIEIAIESVSEENPMDELYEDLRGPHPQES